MKYLLLIGTCLLSALSYGQSKKFIFKLGTEYSLPKKTEDLAFFGNDKDGIINLSLKKDELYISRFDPKSLNQTTEKVIELPEATSNMNSEIVVDFGSNYFWLHSDWDKGSGTEILSYDKIDVVAGKLTNSNTKLFETTKISGVPSVVGMYGSRGKTVGKYDFNYDANRTKLLVSYRLMPEEKNDKKNFDKLGFQVFDENMNKIWGGEFTMPYTEAIMDNSDFTVDGNGNAYLLAKVYDSEKRKEKDKETGLPAYHYEVLKFTKDSKKPIITNITLDDKFIRSTSLIENPQHEIIIACTYSKKSKSNGTDGVFLAGQDATGKLVKYKNGYYEFPIEELIKYETAREQKKREKKDDYEASNLWVRNVTVDADGGVFIALEEYYTITSTYTSNGHMYTTTDYYYYDIIAAKINASGNFDWVRKIPKKQMGSAGTGTMSFKLVSDATGYYFLYLDNLKNMELAENEAPRSHIDGMGGQVVVSKISMDGKLSKELVFDSREEEVKVYPVRFSKINKNQFVGRAVLKKTLFKPLLITVN